MSTKIIVGNLPIDVDADFVEQLCSGEPTVTAVSLRKNSIGRSLGFAVIDISNPNNAVRLVEALSQQTVRGRRLSASLMEASPEFDRHFFKRLFARCSKTDGALN